MLLHNDRHRQIMDDSPATVVTVDAWDVASGSPADLEAALNDSSAVVLKACLNPNQENYTRALQALSADERARCATFATSMLAARFAIGRSLVRDVLGRVTGHRAREVQIRRDEHGKPHLADPSGTSLLWFSVAHSGDLLIIALSRQAQVGVDVEQLRPILRWEQIAERALTALERTEMNRAIASGIDPSEALLRQWCRVEACFKAIGIGIPALGSDARGECPSKVRVTELARLLYHCHESPAPIKACGAVALWAPREHDRQ